MVEASDDPLRVDLLKLMEMCRIEPFEIDGGLFHGPQSNVAAARESFRRDPTGLEAFVNHVHVATLWDQDGSGGLTPPRDAIRELALLLVRSWASSLLPLLRGRAVLFYAGAAVPDDFAVRFHLLRGLDDTWVDLRDEEFLNREGLAVWQFDSTGLSWLHEWPSE